MYVTTEQARIYTINSAPEAAPLLELGITIISNKIDEYLGYPVVEASYTEQQVNGSGRGLLMLPHLHVTAITKLEYRVGITSWEELSTDNWFLDSQNHLGALGYGYTFAKGTANWRATYTAGWKVGSIPGTIMEVFYDELKRFIERRGDIASQNMGGQSSSGSSYHELDPISKRKLMAYRRFW